MDRKLKHISGRRQKSLPLFFYPQVLFSPQDYSINPPVGNFILG